jgi:hypothetical protein
MRQKEKTKRRKDGERKRQTDKRNKQINMLPESTLRNLKLLKMTW